ncbi:PAS domain S-box-containing protein [Pedobacter sp. UYP30]|uniref:ATP-binding protein n=1 Tax=Pedobacter sp. UYP30 TaxID=1756400 RepID=UPI003394CE0D
MVENPERIEHRRLEALKTYHILDTAEEKDFDDLTKLASQICGTTIALISFVDKDRQWFKSHKGLGVSQTPRSQSFCAHAINSPDEIMVVHDAKADLRFQDNPLVTGDPNISFYAGVPLTNEDGFKLGTLCVIDPEKRTLTEEQVSSLKIIAGQVMDTLELRRKVLMLEELNAELRSSEAKELLLNSQLKDAAVNQKLLIEREKKANTELLSTNKELKELQNGLAKILANLAESEEIKALAIEQAELGTWHIDTKTKEFRPSERMKAFFGYGRDETMPYSAAIEQIEPQFRDLVVDAINESIKKGIPCNMEYPIIERFTNKQRWIRATGKLNVINDPKRPEHFSGTMIDITERKQNEQRKNDFIAMVSHELKTPLTSMGAFIQMLELRAKKQEDDFAINALERVTRQVKKMNAMISGFLDVSRLEVGKIYVDKQHFDLSQLVKEVEEESTAMITSHEIIFAPIAYILVEADRDKIGQVINNLISNAVKYSPKGSRIDVACVAEAKNALMSVKDQGMGITELDQKKLFDRFYRVEGKESATIAGFGIGLYLCSEIILRHDGKIWVKSKLGAGSNFHFSLPLVEA